MHKPSICCLEAATTCDKLVLDDRPEKTVTNPEARLTAFLSVSTGRHIWSDAVGTREGLSAQYVEQHHVPRQGEIPRPRSAVMDQIVSDGKAAIPVFILQITDSRWIAEPVYDYWPRIRAGELAYFILSNLFLDDLWEKSNLSCYRWQKHCGGLYQTPIAA